MSSNWTAGQLDAITAKNTSVIVSAAAGSGKTSVLVERLLRILSDRENKTPADRIIVVTFTNDAAAQMKQRLAEAISKQLELDPSDEWLAHQQSLIPSAKISTIHSFCFDMIRENIRSLDVSAGFRILDDTEEKLIISKALANVFESFYEKSPEFMNRLSDLTGGASRSDYKLEEAVLELNRFLCSTPFPEKWLENYSQKYNAPFDTYNDPLAKAYEEMFIRTLKRLSKQASYALELASEAGGGACELILSNEADMLLKAAERAENTSLSWNERFVLPPVIWQTCRYPKTEKDSYEASLVDMAKDIRQKYKDKYKEMSDKYRFSQEDINADYKINGEIISGLARIITELNKEITRLKTEKNGLGFSDAEQLAVKLLSVRTEKGIEPSPLAKELSEYYKVIMIDEFQDANDTQNLIFRLLSHNGTAESNGDNLFEVGDVKQSIYRFRLANPKIFTDALEAAEPYTKDYTGKNAYVLLNKNFRSSSDVVEFVNDAFSCLMSKRNGGTDYTSAERLELGAEYPEADRATEFIFANELENNAEQPSAAPVDGDDEEDSSDELTVAEINAEAYAAAEKIKSMLGKVTVTEKGVQRPCECRDFCILLRDRARGQLYADALAAQGIKAYCEETAGYLGSREISVLINLLTVIDNPMKDIPLVSVLMSPMFMLTADEAAELRMISKDPYDRIYKSVTAVLDEADPAPFSARDKLERFMKIYKKLRICAASQSLERLIRTIYDSTDFLASVQAYADGEQKKANLRLLLEYAKSYEQNSEGGLSGFLRYLNDISEKGGDFVRASVVSPAANIVSIKTIHKSKGLEYPFVFLCGSSKLFNLTDTYASMQVNLDYGAGFKIQNRETLQSYSSFPQYVIGCINRSETVSEEMRLLYVALTRAREKLFITIPQDEKAAKRIATVCTNLVTCGGITEDITAEARSMQDWLLQVLLTHQSGKNISGGFAVPERSSSCRIIISNSGAEDSDKNADSDETKPQPQKDRVEKLLEDFRFIYDDKLSSTAAKLTITEIAKNDREDIFLRRPDFSADHSKLTAAEIGTAMHTFMQYADYTEAEKDVKAQAQSLADRGLLSEKECSSLDIKRLEAFFRSGLYERMKKSPEICREQKFLIEISELSLDDELGKEYNNTNGMLQGIADCFFAEEDGIILLDYKTDRVSSENTLTERYYRQLYLYSIALEKIFGRRVKEAYLYSFALDKEIRVL